MKISKINSRTIINSASKWTIETSIELSDGSTGKASIPGGISKGKNEVDALPASKAVERVGEIAEEIKNRDFDTQKDFDDFLLDLDGTNKKSKLGGNTILSLSIAFCKASAKTKNLKTYEYLHTLLTPEIPVIESDFSIPRMMMLILEGGLHGSSNATIQEFMVIVDDIQRGVDIYNDVKEELHKLGKSTNVGAEGAFSPEGYDNEQTLSLLSGFLHGENIALDVAASSFSEGTQTPNYDVLLKSYPISSIEDPYGEEDWTNWELFGQKYSEKITVVTDDITTTNPDILRRAINKDIGNAILVKPNQIGTISETLEVINMATQHGWQTIISHRGTDTNDDFIADLAVGTHADYTKFGAPARGERVAKYNRLMQIDLNV